MHLLDASDLDTAPTVIADDRESTDIAFGTVGVEPGWMRGLGRFLGAIRETEFTLLAGPPRGRSCFSTVRIATASITDGPTRADLAP